MQIGDVTALLQHEAIEILDAPHVIGSLMFDQFFELVDDVPILVELTVKRINAFTRSLAIATWDAEFFKDVGRATGIIMTRVHQFGTHPEYVDRVISRWS